MATTFLDAGTDQTQDTLTFYPNQFFGGTGSASSATDQVHTGTRSLKLICTDASSPCYVATADGACADAGTRTSAYIRLSGLPAATDTAILGVAQAGFGSTPIAIAVTSGGKLRLYQNDDATAVGAAGATTVSAGTWFRLAWCWVITTTTNWSCKVYINGVLEFTRTNADATLVLTGTSQFMPTVDHCGGGTREALTVWYDDLYVDNSSALTDPGNILVTAKRPFANGTTNGFTTQIGAGGSGYGSGHAPQVNEQPLSQTNGWAMIGAGSAVTEEYNVEGLTVGDVNLTGASIVDWMGWVFAKALTSETGNIVVGSTQTNIALTSTPTLFLTAKGSTTYPAGTGTDIGIITATTVTTVSLYECGVIVAYQVVADGQEWMTRERIDRKQPVHVSY